MSRRGSKAKLGDNLKGKGTKLERSVSSMNLTPRKKRVNGVVVAKAGAIVRGGVSIKSAKIGCIPFDSDVVCGQIRDRRIEVLEPIRGWTSMISSSGRTVVKLEDDGSAEKQEELMKQLMAMKPGKYLVESRIRVRQGKDKNSDLVGDLDKGRICNVLEIDAQSRRAKIDDPVEGWVTIANENGKMRLKYIDPDEYGARAAWDVGSQLEVYSVTQKKWYTGVVYKTANDVLTVQYKIESGEIKQKELDRMNEHLRPRQNQRGRELWGKLKNASRFMGALKNLKKPPGGEVAGGNGMGNESDGGDMEPTPYVVTAGKGLKIRWTPSTMGALVNDGHLDYETEVTVVKMANNWAKIVAPVEGWCKVIAKDGTVNITEKLEHSKQLQSYLPDEDPETYQKKEQKHREEMERLRAQIAAGNSGQNAAMMQMQKEQAERARKEAEEREKRAREEREREDAKRREEELARLKREQEMKSEAEKHRRDSQSHQLEIDRLKSELEAQRRRTEEERRRLERDAEALRQREANKKSNELDEAKRRRQAEDELERMRREMEHWQEQNRNVKGSFDQLKAAHDSLKRGNDRTRMNAKRIQEAARAEIEKFRREYEARLEKQARRAAENERKAKEQARLLKQRNTHIEQLAADLEKARKDLMSELRRKSEQEPPPAVRVLSDDELERLRKENAWLRDQLKRLSLLGLDSNESKTIHSVLGFIRQGKAGASSSEAQAQLLDQLDALRAELNDEKTQNNFPRCIEIHQHILDIEMQLEQLANGAGGGAFGGAAGGPADYGPVPPQDMDLETANVLDLVRTLHHKCGQIVDSDKKKLVDHYEQQIHELSEALARAMAEKQELVSRCTTVETWLTNEKKQNVEGKHELARLNRIILEMRRELQQVKDQKRLWEQRMGHLKRENAEVTTRAKRFHEEMVGHKTTTVKFEKENMELQQRLRGLGDERDVLAGTVQKSTAMARELEEHNRRLAGEGQEMSSIKADLEFCKAELAKQVSQNKTLEDKMYNKFAMNAAQRPAGPAASKPARAPAAATIDPAWSSQDLKAVGERLRSQIRDKQRGETNGGVCLVKGCAEHSSTFLFLCGHEYSNMCRTCSGDLRECPTCGYPINAKLEKSSEGFTLIQQDETQLPDLYSWKYKNQAQGGALGGDFFQAPPQPIPPPASTGKRMKYTAPALGVYGDVHGAPGARPFQRGQRITVRSTRTFPKFKDGDSGSVVACHDATNTVSIKFDHRPDEVMRVGAMYLEKESIFGNAQRSSAPLPRARSAVAAGGRNVRSSRW